MKKYERTLVNELVFTAFNLNFGFWAALGQQRRKRETD